MSVTPLNPGLQRYIRLMYVFEMLLRCRRISVLVWMPAWRLMRTTPALNAAVRPLSPLQCQLPICFIELACREAWTLPWPHFSKATHERHLDVPSTGMWRVLIAAALDTASMTRSPPLRCYLGPAARAGFRRLKRKAGRLSVAALVGAQSWRVYTQRQVTPNGRGYFVALTRKCNTAHHAQSANLSVLWRRFVGRKELSLHLAEQVTR